MKALSHRQPILGATARHTLREAQVEPLQLTRLDRFADVLPAPDA